MPKLPDDVYDQIERLSERGNALATENKFSEALASFREALALVPVPIENWDAGMWLLVSIGDMQFMLNDFDGARDSFMSVAKISDDAQANPFVCLRLGQSLFELDDKPRAADWLARAFLSEGASIFSHDHSKYLTFIKTQLKPPPEGWPE
jgi:tetratricopeptide (TPR) repeat protein